jgi:AraC-like DNA-binding protein
MLSDYLLHEHRRHHTQADEAVQYAIGQIMHAKGNLALKDLQQKLQLSERTLERKFNQAIGISPKLFSRICRFQESLQQLRAGNYDKLSDVAYEQAYFDQSYFIRVFKEFTGFSPLEFKKTIQ